MIEPSLLGLSYRLSLSSLVWHALSSFLPSSPLGSEASLPYRSAFRSFPVEALLPLVEVCDDFDLSRSLRSHVLYVHLRVSLHGSSPQRNDGLSILSLSRGTRFFSFSSLLSSSFLALSLREVLRETRQWLSLSFLPAAKYSSTLVRARGRTRGLRSALPFFLCFLFRLIQLRGISWCSSFLLWRFLGGPP